MISPYHMPMLVQQEILTDLLIAHNEEDLLSYQSKKLIAKLREVLYNTPSFIFYKEFPQK